MRHKYIIFLVTLLPFLANAQKEKPTVTIIPSDNWCLRHYYFWTYNSRYNSFRVCDYQRAFLKDPNVKEVISKLGAVLSDRGYNIGNYEKDLESLCTVDMDTSFFIHPLSNIIAYTQSPVYLSIDWMTRKERVGKTLFMCIDFYTCYGEREEFIRDTILIRDTSIPSLMEQLFLKNIADVETKIKNTFNNRYSHSMYIKLLCDNTSDCTQENIRLDTKIDYYGIEKEKNSKSMKDLICDYIRWLVHMRDISVSDDGYRVSFPSNLYYTDVNLVSLFSELKKLIESGSNHSVKIIENKRGYGLLEIE